MLRALAAFMLAVLFLLPAGCATTPTQKPAPFAGYPFRHARYDFKVAWKTTPAPEGLVVDVVLKNVRYIVVNDLILEIFLQSGEKVLARGSDLLTQDLKDADYAKLRVVLKNAKVAPGDKLHFQIRYTGIEGDGAANKVISDFTTDAVTGSFILPRGEEP